MEPDGPKEVLLPGTSPPLQPAIWLLFMMMFPWIIGEPKLLEMPPQLPPAMLSVGMFPEIVGEEFWIRIPPAAETRTCSVAIPHCESIKDGLRVLHPAPKDSKPFQEAAQAAGDATQRNSTESSADWKFTSRLCASADAS